MRRNGIIRTAMTVRRLVSSANKRTWKRRLQQIELELMEFRYVRYSYNDSRRIITFQLALGNWHPVARILITLSSGDRRGEHFISVGPRSVRGFLHRGRELATAKELGAVQLFCHFRAFDGCSRTSECTSSDYALRASNEPRGSSVEPELGHLDCSG